MNKMFITGFLSKLIYWHKYPYSGRANGGEREENPLTIFKKKLPCACGIFWTIALLVGIGYGIIYMDQIRKAENDLECKNCTKVLMN